jgi:HlyD family secretion protein
VVVLLPPQNIKVRAFVSETVLGGLHAGDRVQVRVDGTAETFVGKLSYISPQAEYTPPVIYSRETRAKLVFMIEAVFDPAAAARLHPGQPVEVEF